MPMKSCAIEGTLPLHTLFYNFRSENQVKSLHRHRPAGRVNRLRLKPTRVRQFVCEKAQIRPRPLQPEFGRFMKASQPHLPGTALL